MPSFLSFPDQKQLITYSFNEKEQTIIGRMEEKEDFIKERLLQSLQRGNLQSVTFVGKDGKTEKLFISPDIPLGALKVYDENKTRILNTKPGRKRIHRK